MTTDPQTTPASTVWMPHEGSRHHCTFLAWPARTAEWDDLLDAVRSDVAGLARAISDYEPVVLLASEKDAAQAARAVGSAVEVLPLPVDDLWIRDTGPTFVHTPSGVAGIDPRFNGWGGKQDGENDRKLAERLLDCLGIPRIVAPLVTEGGSIEVDGEGTLMVTTSSVINDNRNPGRTRPELDAALRGMLGVDCVLWMPGIIGGDITDGHIDGLARFTAPGQVVLNVPGPDAPAEEQKVFQLAKETLATSTDAAGRALTVVELPEADPRKLGPRGPEFLASYINYYVVNGAVLVPAFGDLAADDRAAGLLHDLHPDRDVVQVRIDTLADGGGGIHCATQQRPL
ncbi:agmatine deiminase [Tamaricihabitans halophyticus]|uniref:Agmatine deiminase n=1 Tax=Tamaricihabitans halophyticus TaxID=1262583 RepID=A0A4R2R4G7_9PSEU|nr:agmatine deiminase family protein [Tamaricihabitans halophyticus]TCP54265.1 agmatine deiminase [Tamaricihabitans halophyticus]